MLDLKKARKPVAALAVAAAASVAVTLPASPAAASPITYFSYGAVEGRITWYSKHSYGINATIYGDDDTPGFYTQGQYFEGNARIPCGQTSAMSNASKTVSRNVSGSTNCSRANIQIVMVSFTYNGYSVSTQYFANKML